MNIIEISQVLSLKSKINYRYLNNDEQSSLSKLFKEAKMVLEDFKVHIDNIAAGFKLQPLEVLGAYKNWNEITADDQTAFNEIYKEQQLLDDKVLSKLNFARPESALIVFNGFDYTFDDIELYETYIEQLPKPEMREAK